MGQGYHDQFGLKVDTKWRRIFFNFQTFRSGGESLTWTMLKLDIITHDNELEPIKKVIKFSTGILFIETFPYLDLLHIYYRLQQVLNNEKKLCLRRFRGEVLL